MVEDRGGPGSRRAGVRGAAAADAGPASALRAEAGAYDVTLPTGDTVHVGGEDTTVTPAAGRSPAFSVRHSGGDLYVVPDDRLADDPERYNVTALHERRRSAAPEPKASGELVTVRVRSIARDGRPGLGTAGFLNVKDASIGNAHRPLPGDPDAPCTDERWNDANCVRLVPGTYSVMGVVKTMPSWAPSTGPGKPLNHSLVGYPEIEITRDTEIVLDARKAEEVTVRTPEHATAPGLGAISHLMWTRGPANGRPWTRASTWATARRWSSGCSSSRPRRSAPGRSRRTRGGGWRRPRSRCGRAAGPCTPSTIRRPTSATPRTSSRASAAARPCGSRTGTNPAPTCADGSPWCSARTACPSPSRSPGPPRPGRAWSPSTTTSRA
ncbi:hypothetical protein ACFQY7_52070 [Actinomadura luteofluorescens]|uniref:hypothetical protein n=1 Tax=Actinomadura luteofluorescens TaxID=46163 RepID=UPI00362FC0C6